MLKTRNEGDNEADALKARYSITRKEHCRPMWCVNDNYLIACFDKVDTDLITEIAKQKPYHAVFRDSSFANDSAMADFEQVFKTYSPNTIRSVP